MSYEIVVVNYGRRQTVKSEVFLNWSVYREPDAPIGMDYYFWVIRNAERTVVVDTGFSAAGGASRGRDTLIAPADALSALGVDPADAPAVIVTHAHYDHIGNLGLFPASPIVIADAELAFWSGPHAHHELFAHSVEDVELAGLRAAVDGGRVTAFDERITVAPGIEVLRVGGHTPGQSVVAVATDGGTVLLASDAVHYDEELRLERPFAHVADVLGTYQGFAAIRELAAERGIRTIVSGHDPAARGLGEPIVDGPLAGLATVLGGVHAANAVPA